MNIIFLISLKSFTDDNEAIALSDDGQMLAHFSNIEERSLMDIFKNSVKAQDLKLKFDKKYPKGWKVLFVPTKSFQESPDLLKALKKFTNDDIDGNIKDSLW